MLRDFQSFWPTQTPGLYLVLVSFVFYLLGLMLGRWLKHRIKVELALDFTRLHRQRFGHSRIWVIQVEFPGVAVMGLLAAITAAFPINALLRRFVWPLCGYPGEKSRIPSFLPQVVAIALFVFAMFFGLATFYHVTIAGLLTGSGLIAIIIGLALQDTLGNIFAGFGLQAGKAYRVGDWLIVDGKHVEVVEINWRSTRFRNNDDVSFDIPNSQLAKATIVNLYYPSRDMPRGSGSAWIIEFPPMRSKSNAPGFRSCARSTSRPAGQGLPDRLRRIGRAVRNQILADGWKAASRYHRPLSGLMCGTSSIAAASDWRFPPSKLNLSASPA